MNARAFFKTLACLSGISFIQPLALFSEPKPEQNAKVYRFKFDAFMFKHDRDVGSIFINKERELCFLYFWADNFTTKMVLVSEIQNGGCCFNSQFSIYPHGEIDTIGIVENEVIWTLK